MKLQCLHFNNKKLYSYITHFESEYYLFCEDNENGIYSLVKYDKEKSTARDILFFEEYFDFKKDDYDKSTYILGRVGNSIAVYKLSKNVIIHVFDFLINVYDKIIDFFVLKGYVFFYLRSVDYGDLILYMYDKRGGFILIEDTVLKNLLNAPILFKDFESKREIVVIEEFYIKNFFTSLDITGEDNFKNNIYLISLDELIFSIKNKKEILYNILRSNKGLNYITILGKSDDSVVLFLSKPFYDNEILFYDVLCGKVIKRHKSKNIFLNSVEFDNRVYFKATNDYDNEIIYDSRIRKVFSWQKNDLFSSFMFFGFYEDRYLVFKKENLNSQENVYNIYDRQNHFTKTFSSKLIMINDEILL